MASLTLVYQWREPICFPLETSRMVLGCDPGCDLVVNSDAVSPRHCGIRRDGDTVTLCDLASSTGTFVNGERIKERVLKEGDEIVTGSFRWRFTAASASDSAAAAQRPLAALGNADDESTDATSAESDDAKSVDGEPAKKKRAKRKKKATRDDLAELEIDPKELRKHSGVASGAVIRGSIARAAWSELGAGLAVSGIFGGLAAGVVALFARNSSAPFYMLVGIAGLTFFCVLADFIGKVSFARQNRTYVNLLDDVDRFNAVLKAVDVNDQIKAAGNPGMGDDERSKVVAALRLAREELLRALKTERILRENKDVAVINAGEFDTHLAALNAMQVNDHAGEQGRLLDETLKVALGVQEEMKKMRDIQKQGVQ